MLKLATELRGVIFLVTSPCDAEFLDVSGDLFWSMEKLAGLVLRLDLGSHVFEDFAAIESRYAGGGVKHLDV
jgi:hypothetical protein